MKNKIEQTEQIKTTKLSDISCPVCGGPVNTYQVTGYHGESVDLLCECWSGNIHLPSNRHLFKVWAPVTFVNLEKEETEQ
jgi:hypothetical protein